MLYRPEKRYSTDFIKLTQRILKLNLS